MPCWYYDKNDLVKTPSGRHGIREEVEARFRREGARLIMDTGTKLGLRFDTCATGVVYFHRFYMFHSFQDFHRYVTAACCLFLAGKVEETPKKCKDIIKMARSKLPEPHCQIFSDDSREEVMTLERILLQTIKFDLQVEHPYAYLLKFSKLVKGDKKKIEQMVQMAWTFINDSLCTTLSLQWEPDVIAVALMYLASRLTKFDIQDWTGKVFGTKGKWWDHLVEDVNIEFLEDICHQVLDLYSASSQAKEDSPPPPPPPPQGVTPSKRSRPTTPQELVKGPPPKMSKIEVDKSHKGTPHSGNSHHTPAGTPGAPGPPTSSNYNPYVSTQMYSSSFMSQEGAQSIQSMLGGGRSSTATYPPSAPPPTSQAPYPQQKSPYPPSDPSYRPSYPPSSSSTYSQQQQFQGSYPPPQSQGTPGSYGNQQYPYPSTASTQYPAQAAASSSAYSQNYGGSQQPNTQQYQQQQQSYAGYSNSNYPQQRSNSNQSAGNGGVPVQRVTSRRR